MHLQPSANGRRPLGTPGRNSPQTVKRLQTMLDQSLSQADAKSFVELVKPAIQGMLGLVNLAHFTLQIQATRDSANPNLPVRLKRNPPSDHWSAMANHLTLWVRKQAKAKHATVVIRRNRVHAANDVFLVTVNLTGEPS